jgi:hypothetical protein
MLCTERVKLYRTSFVEHKVSSKFLHDFTVLIISGVHLNFGVKVGVEESIVKAPLV